MTPLDRRTPYKGVGHPSLGWRPRSEVSGVTPAPSSGLPAPLTAGGTHRLHGSLPDALQRPHFRPQLLAGQPRGAGGRLPHTEVAGRAAAGVRRGAVGRGDEPVEAEVEEDVHERHGQQQPHGRRQLPGRGPLPAFQGPCLHGAALRRPLRRRHEARSQPSLSQEGRRGRGCYEHLGLREAAAGRVPDAGSSWSPTFYCRVEQKAALGLSGRVSVSPTAACTEERQAPRSQQC